MGAAAGAAVEPFDLDDAQETFPVGGAAQALRGRSVFKTDRDRAILEHDLVGAPLSLAKLLGRECGYVQVDRRRLAAQVEADRLGAEQGDEHGREQVLAAVLLHVVESPGPVDEALDFIHGHRRGQAVTDLLALVDDVDHGNALNPARVVRLSARSRIERRPVQIDFARIAAPLDDARPKLFEVGVAVVEALGHSMASSTVLLE